MKIYLNPKLNRNLRDKINEYHNFTYEKQAKFKTPNRKQAILRSYNCLCACLDRIDELVKHCNTIDMNTILGLYDILNYGQTLIDCITMVAKIYDISYVTVGDTSSFNQLGNDNTGNDESYFKYLRSLCSVHPIETSQHKQYQGNEPEWCPYIISANGILPVVSYNNLKLVDADFYAVVYRNDMETNKYVPIKVAQIINYLNKRYNYITEIISAVEKYNQKIIEEFIEKKIPQPSEYSNYMEYLHGLKEAVAERCGKDNTWLIKEWMAIMNAHFSDETMQEYLEAYQVEMQKGISKIHIELQNMDKECDIEQLIPLKYSTDFIPNKYALEKLAYLDDEFWSLDEDDILQLMEKVGKRYESDKIGHLLSLISDAHKNNASTEELRLLSMEIDTKFDVTNSEWARIQLKIIEPYFNNIVKFDYSLNDWYLHLQVKIALWLMTKKHSE